MKHLVCHPAARVEGVIRVPGDKSISHRAILLGAVASGPSRVRGFLPGEDCLATLAAVRAMGVLAKQEGPTDVNLEGAGLRGLKASAAPLDMGNSGTAMRLLTGLLAGQAFDSELIGDESLSRRPMERVAEPLRRMGAAVHTRAGCPPVRIRGRALAGIRYDMPVASAQVKSAVLLAGLYATGDTTIIEPAVTRDHTERMLAAFGQPVRRQGRIVTLAPAGVLHAATIDVPGDLSSATFFVLAAALAREGQLVIEDVGLNPTRAGILDIFRRMGVDLTVEVTGDGGREAETVGRLIVRPSRLRGVVIPAELVPLAIDEFPAVFAAAALAEGETVVTGAAELRHKESDRIAVMAAALRTLGAEVAETPDGACIRGGRLSGGDVDCGGDHRIAMAMAVAAMRAAGDVRVRNTANVATSFPGFARLAAGVGLAVEETADDDAAACS